MYYVYVLYLEADSKLYYGFTNNLRRRLEEHKSSGILKGKKFELIYYEAYRNRADAMNRERYFKSGWGRSYIKKILKNVLKDKSK